MVRAPAAPCGDVLTSPSTGATDLRLFLQVADRWRLSTKERAVALRVPASTLYRWLHRSVPATLPPDASERIGHLLAIDLAAQACYGPGTALANDAVRRPGTAPDNVHPAWPLCCDTTAALVAVRHGFEARAGGAPILTLGPMLTSESRSTA
jgi:hypothetical protein